MIPRLILVQGATQLEVPPAVAFDLAQTYEALEGAVLHRMLSGVAIKQTHWRKTRTTISGAGRVPPAFGAIDFSDAFDVWCVAPRAIQSTAAVMTLPSGRRGDVPPCAVAMVGDVMVPTSMALAGDVATVTAVAGASGYRVNYWPVLTCFASPPRETGDARSAESSWELTAEEA